MTAATRKILCITCGKENIAYRCEGCSQTFGINHQSLLKQLDEIQDKRSFFQQILLEQKSNPQEHKLIEQINQWEKNSINKIQKTADQARKLIIKYTEEHFNQVDIELNQLTEQLRKIRREENFNEIHLNKFKQKLKELEELLKQPPNISIHQDNLQSYLPNIDINARWTPNGITVAGGNGPGSGLNQFHSPLSICVDDNQTIYVADYQNHRLMEWKKDAQSGQVVAGGKGAGNGNDQFNGPTIVIVDKQNGSLIICDSENRRVVRCSRRNGSREETIISSMACWGLTMDNDGYLYVSDIAKHEVRRWKIGEKNGTLVAGGNGAGDGFDQLNQPLYIFVDPDQSVYISDYGNHRVMKWVKGASQGVVVAGGQGQGNDLKQLSNPLGVVVDQLGTVYVADQSNHRVMRWMKGATEGNVVVGGNGSGAQVNQLNTPLGLFIDRQNDLYVVEQNNHRIQKFDMKISSTS